MRRPPPFLLPQPTKGFRLSPSPFSSDGHSVASDGIVGIELVLNAQNDHHTRRQHAIGLLSTAICFCWPGALRMPRFLPNRRYINPKPPTQSQTSRRGFFVAAVDELNCQAWVKSRTSLAIIASIVHEVGRVSVAITVRTS